MKVNGKEITAKEFAYDGCHKIYLIQSYTEKREAEENGYKIYPIKDLPEAFWNSCPLRFIAYWDLSIPDIVPQCEEVVTFEGVDNNGKVVNMNFATDECEGLEE